MIKQSDGLQFVYDNSGVIGVIYGGEQYFYRKDAQGNIIAILDNVGSVVVRYIYDCWGNHAVVDADGADVTDGIGILNPYRYRGYYYDTETGLYYLQTRYYDPELGRFISQDSIEYADPKTINGLNLYAYCLNNPVVAIDPNGTISKVGKIFAWIGTVLALVVVTAAGIALTVASFGTMAPLAAFGCAVVGGALLGLASAATSNIVSQVQTVGWDNVDLKQTWIAGGIGFATGAFTSALTFGAGAIVGGFGQSLGFAIGTSVAGQAVSTVISTGTLMSIGGVLGCAIGSLGGSFVGDYLSSDIIGQPYNGSSAQDTFISNIMNWVLHFCHWATKL